MDDSSKPKARRPGLHKVRTGCGTCKIRRVKCDETKPKCMKCTSFGRVCDGYLFGISKPTSKVLRPLYPRTTIVRSALNVVPGEAHERQYFFAFCHETAVDLAGPFESEFWSRIVPQAAHVEPSIRYAATAITALSKGLETTHFDRLSTLDEHHRFGLLQYNKAILSLKSTLQKNENSLRVALIACLLFVCIETLQGDPDTARQQVHSGLNLLRLAQCSDQRLTATIEEEVWRLYSGLSIQGCYMLFNAYPSEWPRLTQPESEMCLSPIPQRFTNLKDAKSSLDQLLNAISIFHRHFDHGEWQPGRTTPAHLLKEYRNIQIQLQEWDAAFQSLYDITSKGHGQNRLGPYVLTICHKVACIMLEGHLDRSEMAYDELRDHFENIISHSESIIDCQVAHLQAAMPKYALEAGLVPALHLVGAKCRDREIRLKAIHLLQDCPQQEGFWEGKSAAELCRWLMELEEPKRDENGRIPETARYRVTKVLSKPRLKRAWMECSTVVPDENGLLKIKTLNHSWT